MDEQTRNAALDMIVALIAVSALVIGLLSMLVGRLVAWWDRVRSVKHSQNSNAVVMSRSRENERPSLPSSLQTDSRQTADRPMIPMPSRDIMLDIYKLLRKHGVPREDARPVLKAAGLPLDNNLWSQAAPPEPIAVTPIAGRPTSAAFRQDDPDLRYEAPPS